MKKQIISILTAVSLLSGSGIVSNAICDDNEYISVGIKSMPNSFDTLTLSQADYQNMRINMARGIDDTAQIDNICKAFIASSRAYVRKPEAYSSKVFTSSISDNSQLSQQLQFRQSEYDYLSALYDEMGWTITSDNIEFDSSTITIDGNIATATVVESYTYFITDGFSDESFRRREYTFTLSNINNSWKIIGITTNDPWETNDSFDYASIDVKQQLLDASYSIPAESDDLMDEKEYDIETTATTLYQWTYDTSKAVEYAKNHYSDTSNTVFGFTEGNDCQNFSSQCVWAGLGGSGTSTTSLPAVSTSRVGSDAFNVWCRNQCTTYYSDYYLNWPWDNVKGFAKLMRVSKTTSEGPFGNTMYSKGIQNAEVGNVLSVDWDGAPAESTLDHAMFVTEVTGTAGSRTKSNVKIAAHTSPTNSAYQTVSSYATSTSIDSFARSYIYRGYYSVEQS